MDLDEQMKPGNYWPEPGALPHLLAGFGFAEIQVDALAVSLVPDDHRNTPEAKMAFVDAQETIDLEYVDRICTIAPATMIDDRTIELKRLICERHDQRRRMIAAGIAVWDYEIDLTLIVRGNV